jgi:hypothetical protein
MRVLASAALLLLVALAATGAAAVEGVVPAADEIAANERAKEAASLEAEVGQLKAKISGLGACAVYIGSRSPRCCSVVSVFRCLCWV